MAAADSPILDSTIDQIRAGWAARLEIELACLENSGLTLIPREGAYGLTTVRFFDSIIAICQPALLPILSPLSPVDFLNMPLLLKRLNEYKVNPIGIASIAYADSGTLKKPSEFDNARKGIAREVESILSSCAEIEQEESGVIGMPFIFISDSTTGTLGAVAGYEVWSGKIAQLGVLTKPEHRGQGLASSAAHAASQDALKAGLVPQWRCRLENARSERISQKLGFHKVGLQLALNVFPSNG